MTQKNKSLIILGPTGIGKTKLSIDLSLQLDAEIVSFDSRQFYKELLIGSAPPSTEELNQVKHHFILDRTIKEEWNAADFGKEAILKLKELDDQNKRSILVGGSGLYLNSILYGFDDIPAVPKSFREKLNHELEELGLEKLCNELAEKDQTYYQEVDLKNPQRLIRALEVIRFTKKPFSDYRTKPTKELWPSVKIGLEMDRGDLYDRINQRVDSMIALGLEAEAKSLYEFRNINALQTVGYKEWWPYFENHRSLEEVILEIKKNSRRYAKRQMTWFKKDDSIHWFHPTDTDKILAYLNMNL